MNCNSIEWLVDLLGTMDLLAYVISTPSKSFPAQDVSERGQKKSDFKAGRVEDGLYFCDGHWYSVKDSNKTDSYTLDYQIKGTAHFCQTFAAIVFKGEDGSRDLRKGQYAHNIRVAMAFWTELFISDTKIANYFIKEIQTSLYAQKSDELAEMKKKRLLEILQEVSANADHLVGCKQG